MKVVRSLANKVQTIVENIKYKKAIRSIDTSNTDTVYVDLGSSSIKMGYKGELITFRSSVRKVTDVNEVSISENYILVNKEWYAVAEASVPVGNYEYKYQKPSRELILYGLMQLSKKVEIDNNLKVAILLPFNELKYKSKFKSINGKYTVANTKGEELNVTLTLSDRVNIEGECSKYYIEQTQKAKGMNTVVVNIGNKTTDISVYNSSNNRESISSINMGCSYLMSKMLRFTKAPASGILNAWLVDGYRFTREEEKNVAQAKNEFIELIWNDVYNSSIRVLNPQNTICYIVGGGANLVTNEIKNNIDSEITVKTLGKTENVYSDILGAMMINKDFNVSTPKFEGVNEEVEQLDFDIEDVKVEKKMSNFERFVVLLNKGYCDDDIAKIMNMKKQTIWNYKSKYKKMIQEI